MSRSIVQLCENVQCVVNNASAYTGMQIARCCPDVNLQPANTLGAYDDSRRLFADLGRVGTGGEVARDFVGIVRQPFRHGWADV